MIEEILPASETVPFHYEQIGSVLVSESPVVLDLLFLREINGLVIKNFPCLEKLPTGAFRQYAEIDGPQDLLKLQKLGFGKSALNVIHELLVELSVNTIGVEVTKPHKQDYCEVDKHSCLLHLFIKSIINFYPMTRNFRKSVRG